MELSTASKSTDVEYVIREIVLISFNQYNHEIDKQSQVLCIHQQPSIYIINLFCFKYLNSPTFGRLPLSLYQTFLEYLSIA